MQQRQHHQQPYFSSSRWRKNFNNKETHNNEISDSNYAKSSHIASVRVSEDEDPFSSASDSSWDNDIQFDSEREEYKSEELQENINEDMNNNDENEDDYRFDMDEEDNYMFGDDEEEEFFFDNESR